MPLAPPRARDADTLSGLLILEARAVTVEDPIDRLLREADELIAKRVAIEESADASLEERLIALQVAISLNIEQQNELRDDSVESAEPPELDADDSDGFVSSFVGAPLQLDEMVQEDVHGGNNNAQLDEFRPGQVDPAAVNDVSIYSNIGVTQNFDVKTHTFTISANYFGLAKIYDSGFQLSLGMAL